MAMIHLRGGRVSLVIDTDDGVPQVLWFGADLGDIDESTVRAALGRPVTIASQIHEAPLSLLPEPSRGFTGHPGLRGQRDRLDWSPRFEFDSYQLGFDSFTGTCRDPLAGLKIEMALRFGTPTNDVLVVEYTLTNEGDSPYSLDELLVTLPLAPYDHEVLGFDGRWCHEFSATRTVLGPHALVRESRRGRTSSDRFPGVFVGEAGFGEHRGNVTGWHLGWSGNHVMRVERMPDGRGYIQLGELFDAGEMVLQSGESYTTPQVFASTSTNGLNQASQQFHTHWRSRPGHPSPQRLRPVTLNTWEAVYFKHDMETLQELARKGAEAGVERFVLDDGWFGSRRNDRAGLGDWWVDLGQYPEGLAPLITLVRELGMEFGLWVEPEMVNPDSDLYRQHPDWVLAVDGYPRDLSRNQLVLDLTNPEVFDYLFTKLDGLLTVNAISYLKWDMNRDTAQPAHFGRATMHNQTLALYRLIDKLMIEYPRLEIESCASGGGRIDAEILKRTMRVWTSDCNDPLERQHIQRGASYFWPPEILGSHIGPPKSHTTARTHSTSFRSATAIPYHLGVEWNLIRTEQRDFLDLRGAIGVHKTHRKLFHSSTVVRQEHPDPSVAAVAFIAADKAEAVVSVAQLAFPLSSINAPVRIVGLDPMVRYEVRMLMPTPEYGAMQTATPWFRTGFLHLTGKQLENHGVQLNVLYPESAFLLHLKAI